MMDINGDGRDSDEDTLRQKGESDSIDYHFGLRVGPSTTSLPGHPPTGLAKAWTGLGRQAAMEGMLSMNLRTVHRRQERIRLYAPQALCEPDIYQNSRVPF